MRRALVTVLAAATLAGCAVGQPSGFTARSNDTCRTAIRAIEALDAPRNATAALAYALDRFTAVEHAVSTLTDSSLPGGQSGRDLRDRWLRPARASLESADHDLDRLRDAVRSNDHDEAVHAFAAAVQAGTAGIDTGLLRTRGLTTCASLFTPVTPPTAW